MTSKERTDCKSIMSEVNELRTFITFTLNEFDCKERERKELIEANEKKEEIEQHNDFQTKRERLKQWKLQNMIDWRDHIKIIDRNNKNKLELKWKNYFVIDDIDENELCQTVINSDQQITTFTNNEFYEYLLSKKYDNNCFKSKRLNKIFNNNPSLIIKTMQMLFRRKFQRNDKDNFLKLINYDLKWWQDQLDLDCINVNEWINKCTHYQISPFYLIKLFIKYKKLFLGYAASKQQEKQQIEIQKQQIGIQKQEEINNYHQPKKRKKNDNKCPKIQLKFLNEISQIPAMNENWKNDELLSAIQYQRYNKWINFAIYVHEIKWGQHEINKIKNPDSYQKLFEFDKLKNKNMDKLLIPNIRHILNEEMVDAITRLSTIDGTIRDNIRIYNDFTVREPSKYFEKVVNTKLNDIISIYNNKHCDDLYKNKRERLQIINEKKSKKLHKHRLKKKNKTGDIEPLLSPDLLFNFPININGIDIMWMDCKFFFVSANDKLGTNLVSKSILRYVERFGNGAIICCGFNKNINLYIKTMLDNNNLNNKKVMVLDASLWIKLFLFSIQ